MSSIEDAIALAKSKAGSALVETGAAAGVPAAVVARATPLTMDDLMSAGMAVDGYLKVKYGLGISIGDDGSRFPELTLGLDMSAVKACEAIKSGSNPTVYDKTYDGVTNVKGGSWADTIVKHQKTDTKARPYRSADIAFTVLEDIVATAPKTRGQTLATVGQTLGVSLATTNWKAWADFYANLRKRVEDPSTAKVIIKLTFEDKDNVNKQTWAIFKFEIVEVVDAFPFEIN